MKISSNRKTKQKMSTVREWSELKMNSILSYMRPEFIISLRWYFVEAIFFLRIVAAAVIVVIIIFSIIIVIIIIVGVYLFDSVGCLIEMWVFCTIKYCWEVRARARARARVMCLSLGMPWF